MSSYIPRSLLDQAQPETADPTYRASMLPIGTYPNADGLGEHLGLAWPGMLNEPMNALMNLIGTPSNPGTFTQGPNYGSNADDMRTLLETFLGGQATRGMGAVERGAVEAAPAVGGLRPGLTVTRDAPPGASAAWHNIDFNGDNIGKAYVREYQNTIQNSNFSIDPAYQRQGIGTEVQRHLAETYGKPTVPDFTLSEAAYQRWLKNDPAAVADYKPWFAGASQYSPSPLSDAYFAAQGGAPVPGTRAAAGELFSDNLPSLWSSALQGQQQTSRDPLLDTPPAIVREAPGLSQLKTFASGGNVADSSGLSGLSTVSDNDIPRLAPSMPYHSFLEQLAANPHGWGSAPYDSGSISMPSDPYYGTGGPSIPAQIGYGLSGIPMAAEGIQSAREGSLAGDPVQTIGGIGETALSALPVLGGQVARALWSTPVRAMATGAVAGALPSLASGALSSDDAEARSKYKKRSQPSSAPPVSLPGLTPEQNARLQQIQIKVQNADWTSGTERKALFGEMQSLQNLSADYQRQNNAGLAKAAEIAATAAAQREADQAKAQQESDQLKAEANMPFKQAHPYLSAAIPAVTGGLAGLIGARLGFGSAKSFQSSIDDLSNAWSKAATAAEDAFNSGDFLSATRYAHEAANLSNHFDKLKAAGPKGLGWGAGIGLGALGEAGQLAPIVIDKSRALPGSPLEDKTNDQIALTEQNLPNIAGRIALGGLWGSGMGKVGHVIGKATYGEPEMPSLSAGAKADAIKTLMEPSGMQAPTTALDALKTYQAARQGVSAPTQTLLPPPPDTGPEAGLPALGSGPRPGSPTMPAKPPRKPRGQRTTSQPESGANQSESSSSVSPDSKAAAEAELRRYLQNKPDGKAAGGAVDGQGGLGRPVAGALDSDVAGRTDHLPIDVYANSYVFPADFVSSLGEGNTLAGKKVLQHLMENGPDGQHMALDNVPLHYASGGTVPIMAAGGEFVAPPHAAARWGGGDVNRAHEIFDKWVTDQRANTINTLKSLPAPQK